MVEGKAMSKGRHTCAGPSTFPREDVSAKDREKEDCFSVPAFPTARGCPPPYRQRSTGTSSYRHRTTQLRRDGSTPAVVTL